jgi:hypothetical protein
MENPIYNKLSEKYDQLFTDQIIDFIQKFPEKSETGYVNFYPSFGVKPGDKCDFIIYGQALNGWGASFKLNERVEDIKARVKESIAYSNEFYEPKNHCPLDWVNVHWSASTYHQYTDTIEAQEFYKKMDYFTFRSFFWNVTYKLISSYYKFGNTSFEWARKMVWSNLYKIAPLRGNPDSYIKSLQQEFAIELVRKEIEELKPKYCIVLTNEEWWEPFRNGLNSNILHRYNSRVITIEQINNTKIIVTTRPFRGSSNAHVEEILNSINVQRS